MKVDFFSDKLQNFRWDDIVTELKSRAPVLHAFLSMCVDVKRRQRAFKTTHRISNAAAMGVCASVLLRHKNQHLNVLQHIVSLILHRGHAGKQVCFNKDTPIHTAYLGMYLLQVYRRMQKLLLCLSHRRTNSLLDTLGKDFNQDAHGCHGSVGS